MAVWAFAGTVVVGLIGANSNKKIAKANREMADEQAQAQLELQREADARLEEQRQRYRAFEFTNPYANLENPYAGMQNTFEDLTVNQEAARFQMEQGTQQRANIMQSLRGAAGASGVAGLAQSLAQQGTLQARQVSADIGKQETANQRLAAQGAAQMQQLERQGAFQADMARRGGEQMIQEAEMRRQATLLGVAYQEGAGAAAGVNQAYANQMQMGYVSGQMQMQQNQAWMNIASNAPWNDIMGGLDGGSVTPNSYDSNFQWGDGSDVMAGGDFIG